MRNSRKQTDLSEECGDNVEKTSESSLRGEGTINKHLSECKDQREGESQVPHQSGSRFSTAY